MSELDPQSPQTLQLPTNWRSILSKSFGEAPVQEPGEKLPGNFRDGLSTSPRWFRAEKPLLERYDLLGSSYQTDNIDQRNDTPLNTKRIPYETGVDLKSLPDTATDRFVTITIDTPDIALSDLRQKLTSLYDKQSQPDIHAILKLGTILLRSCGAHRIQHILSNGTDRDSASLVDTSYREREITQAHYLHAADVTYVSERKLGWSYNGSEQVSVRQPLLVYDPRYLVKLGQHTNGFSTFTHYPGLALLGVVVSTHPDAQKIPQL